LDILKNIKQFGKAAISKLKELNPFQSKKKVQKLIKEKRKLKESDFKPGNLIFGVYDAKDKEQTYDRTPLVLILKRGKTHTLGLNFHWAPFYMRINLIKVIVLSNAKNVKSGKPLQFSYEELKPLLRQLGYAPIIRLYINRRFGSQGVVIPPERLLEVAQLKTETFTNGRYTAEQMLAKARKRK